MGRVRASIDIPVQASQVEGLWYDLNRWPSFIDGFGHLDRQTGEWPKAGSALHWSSAAGGRGHVLERVVSYEPRSGQELDIADSKMTGRQRVIFEPGPGSVVVTIELEYEITAEWPLKSVMDALFVRRPMRDSIVRTLQRLRREAVTDRELTADG